LRDQDVSIGGDRKLLPFVEDGSGLGKALELDQGLDPRIRDTGFLQGGISERGEYLRGFGEVENRALPRMVRAS
jgi:hypothetical protein